jgi:hypothetical protein
VNGLAAVVVSCSRDTQDVHRSRSGVFILMAKAFKAALSRRVGGHFGSLSV